MQEDGVLTISTAACDVLPTMSPVEELTTSEPTAAPTAAPTDMSSNSMRSDAGYHLPLIGMAISVGFGGGQGSARLISSLAALAFLARYVNSDTTDNGTCNPSLEIEISVPFDCPFNNYIDGVCKSTTEIADMIVQALFVDFDVEAAKTLLATDYIQHNPTVPTGAAPVLGFIPALQESGLEIEVHRTIAQGNLVAYHSTYTNATLFGGDTLIGFDVFRIENGKVQEHWDNLQPLAGPNPNGNTMVDGPTFIKFRSETDANKELAQGLVTTLLIEGNVTAAPEFISSVSYTQHNPDIADGLDGLFEAFEALAAANMLFVYDSQELVVAEGNFVLIGSAGSFGGDPTAYYDLFRIIDGLAVEHWDVIQPIPPAEEFAHTNGKF